MQVESLTYDELAQRLGITRQSARQLAMRKRWTRKPGNDGMARVSVPFEALTHLEAGRATRKPTGADTGKPTGTEAGIEARNDTPDQGSDARALIAVLESRISELQGRVADLDVEAKQGRAALARVDVLEALLDAERKRLVEQVDPLKSTIEALKGALEAEKRSSFELRENRDRWYAEATARRSWWPWRRSA
jgi:hypothetical protein